MTTRTWTEPATVIIHEALMPDFEDWIASRGLQVNGPHRFGDDPEDVTWMVGPTQTSMARAAVFARTNQRKNS